jgi:hypothetical protein
MSNIYGMRRANGDWFAVEAHRRLRVPLFHTSHEAMMARLRNVGMSLYQPVALDANLLKQIAVWSGGTYVDFAMVTDPFSSLTRGQSLELAEVEVAIANPVKPVIAAARKNVLRHSGINASRQSEWWH